jgi:EAL domain-containing protein (putative c-di-GMP-specific phosphodiesterase class I)
MLPTAPSQPAARQQTQWSLVAQDGGEALPLDSFPCQIGRQPAVGLRIVHPTVSSTHAEFRLQDGALLIADLGSRNGTFLNGQKVTDARPLVCGDLLQFGGVVYRLQNRAPVSAISGATCQSEDVGDLALALAQFDKLISDSSVVAVYQPIVDAATAKIVAYEALARSCLFGLDKPSLMFKAAGYFKMEAELSRLLRHTELTTSCPAVLPHLFLNTHPTEMADFQRLIESLHEIRQMRPEQALTLEVHEAAAVDLKTMKSLREALDGLGMKLAFDDFGAGQARLADLVEARPHYVKFDRKLICDLDKADAKRREMIATLVRMCRQLGIITLAEGVETAGEADVCRQIGFELMQGFFYGRPTAPPPAGLA